MGSTTTTYLEMTKSTQLRPKPCDDPAFRVTEVSGDQWEFNKSLYKLVGEKWEWFDKSNWEDDEWKAYASNEGIRTFIASCGESVAGYFELSQRDNAVEIAYLGLTPDFIGKGLGGALLTRAIEEAWKMKPARVWVHTCNLDHEAALKNYQARGMVIYKTEIS